MKKALLYALFAVSAIIYVCAEEHKGSSLHGTYVSAYGTYYEFLDSNQVMIGDSIEGELHPYQIKDSLLILSDEVWTSDKDTVRFAFPDQNDLIITDAFSQTLFKKVK